MKGLKILIALALIVSWLVAGGTPTSQADQTNTQTEDVLYVALIWHQHQPVYYKDPTTGVYIRPWVRVHATKDYLDMAAMLQNYPAIHATFNLTPSLLRQLDDLAAGAKDLYWVKSEIPAEELTVEDKRFILERFFDANAKVIARFPRYQELANMRQGASAEQIDAALASWTDQDFRDLQVLFNLAWFDPDWLAEEPLAGLVAKERDYAEADKAIIFDETLRIIQAVIPLHAQMQQAGQIEVTMTPYAHPILPLLVNSDIAAVAMPGAELPPPFVYGQDAVAQVQLGVKFYQEHFGVAPRGMWPAEGAVSQDVIQMIANADIQWIATDEEVLGRSLPDIGTFTRNSQDTVQQADALYRPYTVTGRRYGQVAIIFRDHRLSDKVGFEYSGTPGQEAADDFIQQLNDIQAELQAEGATGPHLVTVLLDGENAWENYDNDGKEFLNALYQGLSDAPNLKTVTPSEYLAMTEPPREIEDLWPGSWIDHDFSTWIGEDEENIAWTYLRDTRAALETVLRSGSLDDATEQAALESIYIAEGSDWFWWYGADQNSGADETFDFQFRSYLEQVYKTISLPVPDFVYVPVISQAPQPPTQPFVSMGETVTINGAADAGEWDQAARYDLSGTDPLTGLYAGFDNENLYLRLDSAADFADDMTVGFYLQLPDKLPANAFSRYGQGSTRFGFGAERLIEVTFSGGTPSATLYTATGQGGWEEVAALDEVAATGGVLEIAAPLATVSPAARPGNAVNLRVVLSQGNVDQVVVPPNGPALLNLPEEAVPNVVLDITDPSDDDYGPGTYVYPTDAVFRSRAYDVTRLVVGSDEEDVIFQLSFQGPVENDWDAPNGMGIITVDLYLDVDGPTNGARLLLPGRNAALPADYGWDYAIWAEGWTPGVYQPGEEGPVEVDTPLTIVSNPGKRQITIRVPRAALPGDPAEWAIAAVVGSQDGYPSAGVWRLRDVLPEAQQWRIGGGPDDTNHTRLMDVVYPEAGVQEAMLSNYTSSQASVDELGPDDFPQVPVIAPGG